MMNDPDQQPAEVVRLLEDARREQFWKLWGTYLSERQWGTVREDYSADGDAWTSFSHEAARSRVFRWGEDGLLGFCDRFSRLCVAPVLWNGRDSILKERLFGLAGPQGNHGEDVKEYYYYLDATPTHSYCKALYKYPQQAFPYEELISENGKRTRREPEFELIDTGIFDENHYFDLYVEYAKHDIEDILVKYSVANRSASPAKLHLLPTVWFRNTWDWGDIHEESLTKPSIRPGGDGRLILDHETLGEYVLGYENGPDGSAPELLFTENETNNELVFGSRNNSRYVKDAFHRYLVEGETDAVNPEKTGTKTALHYVLEVPPGETVTLRFRLCKTEQAPLALFDDAFEDIFRDRIREADQFYASRLDAEIPPEEKSVARQAYAGLLWSKQFYNLVVTEWLAGDSTQPKPPPGHADRNANWENLFSRDVISMPDNWEYSYFCVWDLAFHMVSFAHIDPAFARDQLELFLREWYMHPNGQIPAYEWNFSDVNPPVHVWAAWRVYRLPWLEHAGDRRFLESVFQKLLLNFTWWVNRKDLDGNNLFAGGFLGLDNIGVFDRSKPLPTGGTLKQADGTAWMAFYCTQMLSVALELAQKDNVYEDLASKFFEHFVRIVHAINDLGGTGLWCEEDGFYYDMLEVDGKHVPLKVRSIVGFMPLLAVTTIPSSYFKELPDFTRRAAWFIRNRPLLSQHITDLNPDLEHGVTLLGVAAKEHLQRILRYMFDEDEFLAPHGIRSVSKYHEKNPYVYYANGHGYSVDYEPGEGTTGMFGGNSNWRGPIWFPINFLLIEALRIYDRFYGESLKVEFPTGSGDWVTLGEAAERLSRRLISLFLPDEKGARPCHGGVSKYAEDPYWKDLVLFNEYYHAETGRGCGASHQTGWTATVADLINLSAIHRRK